VLQDCLDEVRKASLKSTETVKKKLEKERTFCFSLPVSEKYYECNFRAQRLYESRMKAIDEQWAEEMQNCYSAEL
jgi:hypothetical protein